LERKFFYFALFWTVLIAVLCLVSLTNVPSIPIKSKDKYAHFVFYFVLVLSWFFSFKNLSLNIKVKILCFAILYGIIIEVFQEIFTVNREADIFDVIANSFGAVVAYLIFPFLKNNFSRKE
jgi:VanZ family protein